MSTESDYERQMYIPIAKCTDTVYYFIDHRSIHRSSSQN